MKKPKLLIIVLFQNLREAEPYYARNPAPPLPGILLAGMTPPAVDVEVLHEMVRPVDYATDADFVALSFLDYCAPHAYEVAARFRALGKTVIAGGKFASTFPDEVQPHFDAILVGEAQRLWPRMVEDLAGGRLQRRYTEEAAPSLDGIPPPRYDLVEKQFAVPIVTEASRGCPHPCTYCALNIKRTAHRTRPVGDVVRDLTATQRLPWHKRKMAMVLDNNFGGDLRWAKALLREIAKLDFWAIGFQFSVECLRDDEFVELLAQARCRMAFIGMESLNTVSLRGVQKRQNVVEEYKRSFEKLTRRGILTFTGLMFALDEDTNAYYERLPERLDDVGVSVILPSISIPIYGTPWHREVVAEGRITDTDLSHYEGDHLVFRHKFLEDDDIYSAYRRVNEIFFRWGNIFRRWAKIMRMQTKREPLGQFLLKLVVLTFVYYKLSIFQRHHAQKRVFPHAKTPVESIDAFKSVPRFSTRSIVLNCLLYVLLSLPFAGCFS
jgi:radical SAM superfamily enzyme YgiQ (UPF0313 family)